MPDPFKDLEQDITHLLTAVAKNAAANGAGANGDAEAPRKKSGGQPGNQNARKHGHYAKALTPEQLEAFPEVLQEYYLDKEIAVLRLKIVDLMAAPDHDMKLVLRSMGTLSRMLRTHFYAKSAL